MNDDIVARLREFDADLTKEIADGEHGEDGHLWVIPFECILQAADEIERLRELVSASYRLREERDEARRMVCGLDADIMEDQVEYARHRGWDCFPREDGK